LDQVDSATIYNDRQTADQTGTLTAASLTGLGMGSPINYGSLEVLEIFLGSGDDTFLVGGTMKREDAFQTVTMLNTGPGDDVVTVTLDADADGFFALNAEAGDDRVEAGLSTLPLVIFSGEGNDTIDGGQGDDILFGDQGRIDYRDGFNRLITRLGLGLAERNVMWPCEWEWADSDVPFRQTDGVARRPILITTRKPAAGGIDTIHGNAGDDVIFGGAAGDYLYGEDGNNIVFGDNGQVYYTFCSTLKLKTTSPEAGGADQIITGMGRDVIFGGTAGDVIHAGSGDDLVLGNFGALMLDEGVARNVQTTNPCFGGSDLIYGEDGNDWLYGGGGNNILLGGNGNDHLYAGGGRDILIGGAGKDWLYGGTGDDLLLGDSTIWDNNDRALLAILAEWTSNNCFDRRITHIRNGTGLAAGYALKASTVLDDDAVDELWGDDGHNWFLNFSNHDKVKDFNSRNDQKN
jgi:Ca2+-binding RTX toxin-like protein